MGDVAMLVPVVASLAEQYPEMRITVLSRAYARPFFGDLAPNVNFMEADLAHEYRGVKGLNALYRRLVAKNFTHIADMHGVLRSRYLRMRFNLGRYRVEHIDKHRRGRRQLTAQSNKQLVQQPTVFENYADVLRRLGFPVRLQFTSIFPPEGGNINLLPKAVGPKKEGERWIGIAPFAAHPGKVYPPRLMEQVIDKLTTDMPTARIFLFGRGENESKYFDQWCQKYPQCLNASDRMESLHQELILMSHLNVMVSMDSANQHLASICAVPVVSVWGATHPYAGFLGWRQSPDRCISIDLPCRPCSVFGNKPCLRGDMACMNNIDPLAIVRKVEEIINPKNQENI